MSNITDSLVRCQDTPPPEISFEFFPPKTDKMEETLWNSIQRLAPYHPGFVSVTYGAGGSTRQRTHDTVCRILAETDLTPAAHLTCVAATREEVDEVARRYWECGVRHVVALRGDPPDGDGRFRPHPGGYRNAAELVAGLRDVADFEISVACYPEVHPDAASAEADLDNLKRKLDAGATRAISQYFFDVEDFLRFRDRVAAAGIEVPLTAGIMPVTNYAKICSFSEMCGASIPGWLGRLFEGLDDDPGTRQLVAASLAVELVHSLRAQGVESFHVYTLNRSELTVAICRMLGIRPAAEASVPGAEAATARA